MKCDLILKHGQVYNAYFKKFIEADVVIVDGKFFYIGDASQHDFDGECLDVSGQYIVPGLIDCHVHIESSMTTPTWFAKEVLKHGVTTLIAEPHEIANVYGVEGIKTMLKDGEHCGVDVKLAIPSSVPSTSEGLETTGGIIDEAEVRELLEHEQTICFGEVMNCRDLINDEQSKTRRLVSLCRALRPELPIEGHCPAFMDLELAKILYQGVGADHTEQTPERMEARIQNGMFVQLQNKTLRQENIDYLKSNNLFEHFAIVTDDTMPHDFVNIGHLDALVRKAMGLGLTPEEAIYVTTYTPAKRMRLYDRGAIAPGLLADFIVLDSLDSFAINSVYRLGKLEYAKTMKYEADSASVESIKAATESLYAPYMNSVHVPELSADDFTVKAPIKEGTVNCVLMKVQDGTTFIERQSVEVPVRNYELQWEETPYALACVIERHGKNGNRGFALVGGNALKRGAAATTYAHDHHNLLVLGQTKADMALAANTVVAEQGGYIVVENEEILAFAPLKIAGILYNGPMTDLALDIQNVVNALHGLGYEHSNVIMSLSTLGLPVSPYVKVTDKGLIDVKKQCIIPLIEA